MDDRDLDWALLAIGLSAEEASLYRHMVSRGPSTVGSLAPLARLSRTKAYSVLDRMVAKGYAERVSERPRTYAAVDPDRMLERRFDDFGSARSVIQEVLSPVYRRAARQARAMSLRGNAVFSRAEEMLQRARRETVIVATFIPKELTNRLARLIDEVHDRGVRVRTIVSEALEESSSLRRLKDLADVRVRRVPNAGMLIIDDEEVLIGSLDDVGEDRAGDDTWTSGAPRLHGLWSRDAELIKLQRMLFEDLYRGGTA